MFSHTVTVVLGAAGIDFYYVLQGYWAHPDGYFVAFRIVDGKHCFAYGIFDTEYGTGFGEIVSASYIGEAEALFNFFYPAQAATEMYEARPERTVPVYLDLTSFIRDIMIRVKISEIGNGTYYSYVPHQE